MNEAYEACRTIINDNRDKLEAIAQALMDKETLSSDDLKAIVFAKPPTIEQLLTKEPPIDLSKPDEVNQPNVPDNSSPTPV